MKEIDHLLSLKKGDRTSFNWIFEKYFDSIHTYCLKFIKREEWAEEATSEVFVTLWNKRAILKTDHPVQAFLFHIAKYTVYNYLRKIASDESRKQAFVEYCSLMDTKTGEQLIIEQEDLSKIQKIVDLLPPKRRAVFKMRYYEGLDNVSIAEALQISKNTVKIHLVKARQHLKDHLELSGSELLLLLTVFFL